MYLRSRLAALILVTFLTACTTRPAVLPAATQQAEAPAISTALPGAEEAPAASTLPPVIAQPTKAPKPAGPALPAPQPLTGPAPWILYPCAERQINGAPTIANGDGTGCVPISLPTGIPTDRAWVSIMAGNGSYAAFRVSLQPLTTGDPAARYRIQPNGLDDQLWIIKLPENRIIRKITQVDADGWGQIEEMWQNSAAGPVPLPLAVILDADSYRWSPNGRYLAYTGIDKEGADLFVYDSLNDTIRRMSRGRQGAFLWSWSPENKWMVYHDMARCRLEATGCQLERGPHYFAVAFPQPEYQFANTFPAGEIHWIAKNRYLLQDMPEQGQLNSRLALVNLDTGIVNSLFEQPFYSYTYVPKTYVSRQEMYLLNLPPESTNDRVAGIYQLFPNQTKDRLKPFHTAKYADYMIQWERTFEQFVLAKDLSAEPPGQKEVLLTSVLLLDPAPLGILSSADLYLSPDGNWFTARLGSGSWALYDKQGKQIQELGQGLASQANAVHWRKDSSGFTYFAAGENCASAFGCVYTFQKAQNWEPVLAGMFKAKADVLQVIEP